MKAGASLFVSSSSMDFSTHSALCGQRRNLARHDYQEMMDLIHEAVQAYSTRWHR